MNTDTLANLEEFTCLMLGYPRDIDIKTVCSKMLKKMVGENTSLNFRSKADFSQLPPCRYNLLPHIYRMNHRLAIFKRAGQPSFQRPKPLSDKQGWVKEGETTEPLWSCGAILPDSLIDILESSTEVHVFL